MNGKLENQMKNKLIAAILVSIPVAVFAAKEKTVSQRLPLDPGRNIQIVAERGEFEVVSGEAGTLAYQVEFVPNNGSSWWGTPELTPEQIERSKASYDPETGTLSIETDDTVSAKVRVTLPEAAPLRVRVGAGILTVASRKGYLDVAVDTGIINYDASGLARDVCVDALVKTGVVDNDRDENCASTGASLRAKTGTITVQ